MDIHILDLVFYFVGLVIIWFVCPEDYKHEIGVIAYFFVCVIYTIIYLILFVFIDYNISDIGFKAITNINIKL